MARPRAVPRTVPSTVASGVMIRMSLAPMMTRDNTSRPSGRCRTSARRTGRRCAESSCCASGLYGANMCPNTAQTTQNSKIAAPA